MPVATPHFLDVGSAVGAYRIVRELGRGGMGVVYEAHDPKRDETVALKTLQRLDPSAVYRFKQEFRALADLSHPNLVTLYELVSEDGIWFFTMKLIQGRHFFSYVMGGSDGPHAETPFTNSELTQIEPDERGVETRELCGLQPDQLSRLRDSLRQLAEGVFALHEAGKLHRDIKTSNVLVTHEGQVVLLDFGLAAELGREGIHENTGHHVLGTVAYMSPEQAACQPLSPASDWYSVGVMLYETLVGQVPFIGKSWEILANKQKYEPPRPSLLIPDLPAELDALCVDLLRRVPEARPSGREILHRLRSMQPERILSTPAVLERRTTSLLVGRQQHLAALHEALHSVKQGRATTVYVQGQSGSGKSTLVQHFLEEISNDHETVVLAGRCYEQESVPFKAFDAVIDALSRYLRRLPRAEVEAVLPRDVQSLARLFPTLRCVEAITHAPHRSAESADPQELRRRAFAALRELLARLGDRKTLIVFIDDLQWGDLDSARLLIDLLQPPDAPVSLFIGAFRSEDTDRSPFLQLALKPQASASPSANVRSLAIEPLTETEARELALELLGSRDASAMELAELLARESAGNPFFVHELVQAVQIGNSLTDKTTVGEISLDNMLWDRVQKLAEKPRRLLEIIAVAGRPLSRSEVCKAAEIGAHERSALATLRSGRLIRGTGVTEQDEIEPYHDRIRESVVGHLSAEALQAYHRRLAIVLEISGHADPEELAVHFQGAGDHAKAGLYYATAADHAAEALAFDHAAKLYRLALDLSSSENAPRQALHRKLGDVLANAGRGNEAAAHYLAAQQGADEKEALELRRRAAEQSLISGHIDEGLSLFGSVLHSVGLKLAATPRRALISLLMRRAQLSVRGVRFRERSESDVTPRELQRIDILWSLARGLSAIDPIRSADFQTRNLLLSLRTGEPYRVSRALAMEAIHLSARGKTSARRTAQLLDLADALAQRLGQPHACALVVLARGVAAYLQGSWRIGLQYCDEAESRLRERCTGAAWELDTAQAFSSYALFFMGEIAELSRRWPAVTRAIRDRGDLYALSHLGTFLAPFLQLANDDPVGARRELLTAMRHWARHGFRVHDVNGRGRQVEISLYTGRGRDAWRRLTRYWPDLQKSLLLRVQHLRIYKRYLHARCALAAAEQSPSPENYLREARRDAKLLAAENHHWSGGLAKVVEAALALRQGDRASAIRLLESAANELDSADMRLYAAAARRRLGQLLGGDQGHSVVTEADAWMTSQNIRNPVRMTAMLAPGFGDDTSHDLR